jgi:hypothetical protein
MNTPPPVEARPLLLNAQMPITLTVHDWIQVCEFYMYAEVPAHRGCPSGVNHFIAAIQEMLFTSASIKAREAAFIEEQQRNNPFADMLRAAGVVPPEMTPESFSE